MRMFMMLKKEVDTARASGRLNWEEYERLKKKYLLPIQLNEDARYAEACTLMNNIRQALRSQ